MSDLHVHALADLNARFFGLQERVEILEARLAEFDTELTSSSRASADHPTLAKVLAYAQVAGCAEDEARAFFLHFDAVGWVDKNGNTITNWQSKLGSWMAQKRSATPSPTQLIVVQKELELVERQMSDIRGSYSDNQSWTQPDIDRWGRLKARRDALRKSLGWQKT